MDKIEYEGKNYIRNNANWLDSHYVAVPENLQRILNRLHSETIDFSGYSEEELIAEGDKYKESASFELAISFYEQVLDVCDAHTARYVLPRITSCYRSCGMARRVIDRFTEIKQKFGEDFITPVLLTSVAAAYCDLSEYQNALSCCRWAYKKFGGQIEEPLRRVYARIKKESGLE